MGGSIMTHMITTKGMLSFILVLCIVSATLLPVSIADSNVSITLKGFDKGPSFTNVVPVRKVTFVNLDDQGILDDYAYFAALPTSVFHESSETEKKRLFSHPLLFYQDEYEYTVDAKRTLNARQGINYFMEDWLSYSGGQLDQMTLINVPKVKVNQWAAKDYVSIQGNDPFTLANSIALNDWSYTDDAVIAVIEENYQKPDTQLSGSIHGRLESCPIKQFGFEKEPPTVGIGSTYQTFNVLDEKYKYIAAKLSWIGDTYYDIQLIDEQLGMVALAMGTRAGGGPLTQEVIGGTSFIHNYGQWRTEITAVPMKTAPNTFTPLSFDGSIFSTGILSSLRKNMMDIDISLYPGDIMPIEDQPPFGCRNVDITLTWNNPQINLGFTVLDPIGNEIASSLSDEELFLGEIENGNTQATVHINRLGECIDDDYYSICVFSLDDLLHSVEFNIEYSWQQNYSKNKADGLVSASNGAVLASMLNAPLLYVHPDKITGETVDALYKLGVKDIYLSNLGGHLSNEVTNELKKIGKIQRNYLDAKDIYDDISKLSGNNDVIFSTIEPWNYWHAVDRKPAGIHLGSLHLGPAAYLAAHHGSPVITVDYHPKLSQAATWSVDWWIKNAIDRIHGPPSANMVLTAKRGYEFLEEYGFGMIEEGGPEKQNRETIITIADQFQIGVPWDRSFLGAALSGRFWGSPVDTSYAISRSVFYPALVYENPAMDGVTLTQGSSSSTSPGLFSRLKKPFGVNLVITEDMKDERFQYPILHMYNTYLYRFNEIASNHWDFIYTRADGITPYITPSPDDIDEGAAITKPGKYYPDLSESEVIPFYAEKLGYDNVFSTNFEYVTKNLNSGVLLWIVNSHGWHMGGGMLSYWNPDTPYVFEENPWRAYEPVALKPGNLGKYLRSLPIHYEERIYSDDMDHEDVMSSLDPIVSLLSFNRIPQLFPEVSSTEHPDAAAINFQLERLMGLTSSIRILLMFPEAWNARGIIFYRNVLERLKKNLPLVNWYQGDGKITSHYATGHFPTMKWHNGYEIDDALGNLHSVAINSISCMPSNTFMQLSWMRHGSLYQIMDPWTTTDWAGTWQQIVIKRFGLGDTVGEAFARGIQAAGPLYSVGQWWWDSHQNICLFGNPNQRVFVPDTSFSNNNHWTQSEIRPVLWDGILELEVDGHTLFGAETYPHERTADGQISELISLAIIAVVLIVVVALIVVMLKRKK